jgi:hypothetical protein
MLAAVCCAATAAQYPVKAAVWFACPTPQLAETSKSGNELLSCGREAVILGVKHPGILEQRVHCSRRTHSFYGGKCDFQHSSIFLNSVEKIQVSLKSDKNNGDST